MRHRIKILRERVRVERVEGELSWKRVESTVWDGFNYCTWEIYAIIDIGDRI